MTQSNQTLNSTMIQFFLKTNKRKINKKIKIKKPIKDKDIHSQHFYLTYY